LTLYQYKNHHRPSFADGTPAPLNTVLATELLVRPAACTVVGEISIAISEINTILMSLALKYVIAIF